jgi:hypothetical protein
MEKTYEVKAKTTTTQPHGDIYGEEANKILLNYYDSDKVVLSSETHVNDYETIYVHVFDDKETFESLKTDLESLGDYVVSGAKIEILEEKYIN